MPVTMFGGASDKSSPRKARAGSLGGGDLSKETGIHLEQCFYRRDAAFKQGMDKTGGWRYHNHVLQGRYLRFMTHPIKRKRNVASLRLVLVSGKLLGRMKGLRIHPKSEISVATLSMFSAPEGHLYLINVSGLSPSGVEETWQLACPTEDLQRQWAEQCMHARDLYDLEETNGDAERLRTLAMRMKDTIPVRPHVGKFRIYRKCFNGPRAVKWLQSDLRCGSAQAIAVGNRMLNMGLFHHVHHQFLLSHRMHFYRFGDPSSAAGEEEDGDLEEHPWRDAFDKCRADLQAMRLAFGLLQTVSDNLSGDIVRRDVILGELSREMRITQQVLVVVVAVTVATGYLGADRTVLLDYRFAMLVGALLLSISLYRDSYSKKLQHLERKLDAVSSGLIPSSDLLFGEDEDGEDDGDDTGVMEDEGEDDDEDRDEEADQRGQGGAEAVSDLQLPPPSTWPNFPLLVRRAPSMLPANLNDTERMGLRQPLNIHSDHEFPFETDLFEGVFTMTVQDLPDTPDFGRVDRAPVRCVVQGRFKKPLPMKNVLTGYVYNKPINVPTKPAWLMQAVTQLSRQVQPGLEMNLKGDRPFALAPLICTARAINASRPGEEPSIHGKGAYAVEDDLSLLDRSFLGMTARRRKAFFHKKANLDDFDFDTELVYTFVFESHQLNLPAYCVDLGFTRYSLRRALGTMPMQMLAVMWDSSKFGSGEEPERPEMLPRLWEMEIFHEKAVGGLLSNVEEDAESEMDGVNEYILTSSTNGSLPLSPRTGVVRAERERVEKSERDAASTSAQSNKCSPITSPRASMS